MNDVLASRNDTRGGSLNFCMVTTFYPPYHFGGDAMYIYRLTNELARRGHRVTVVHCVDAYKFLRDAEPTDNFPHHPNVTVHRLRSRLGKLSPLITYLTGQPGLKSAEFDRIFAARRFDVIHFHNISLVGGPGVLRYGNGVKLYTTHEHWLVCPMHVLWKFNRQPCDQPACMRCTLAFHRPPQLWRYTGLLESQLGEVDLFLSPSRFTLDQHVERGFRWPMRHLPHFLPTAETSGNFADSPDDYPLPTERPYFLFVGRLEKLKGLQVVIDKFRDYAAADLIVAGDGDYGPELRRQAAGLKHVHFVGRVQPGPLRSLFARAIALVVPSVGYEVFGLVSIEAFAQRTPAIVHDLGGLAEPVTDSHAGFTYRTTDEMIAAMEALRTNPGLRHEMGERAHAAYHRLWSEEPHLDRYFALIDEARTRKASLTASPSSRSTP